MKPKFETLVTSEIFTDQDGTPVKTGERVIGAHFIAKSELGADVHGRVMLAHGGIEKLQIDATILWQGIKPEDIVRAAKEVRKVLERLVEAKKA